MEYDVKMNDGPSGTLECECCAEILEVGGGNAKGGARVCVGRRKDPWVLSSCWEPAKNTRTARLMKDSREAIFVWDGTEKGEMPAPGNAELIQVASLPLIKFLGSPSYFRVGVVLGSGIDTTFTHDSHVIVT
jgi:hypothetical protein